jgi:hypothetical protein
MPRSRFFESHGAKNKIGLKVQVDEGKGYPSNKSPLWEINYFDGKNPAEKNENQNFQLLRSGRLEQEKFDADLQTLTAFYKKKWFYRCSNRSL